MESTYFTFSDPRLPTDVVTMSQAIEQTDNSILVETMELAIQNGYFLRDVQDDGYILEKLEVDQ